MSVISSPTHTRHTSHAHTLLHPSGLCWHFRWRRMSATRPPAPAPRPQTRQLTRPVRSASTPPGATATRRQVGCLQPQPNIYSQRSTTDFVSNMHTNCACRCVVIVGTHLRKHSCPRTGFHGGGSNVQKGQDDDGSQEHEQVMNMTQAPHPKFRCVCIYTHKLTLVAPLLHRHTWGGCWSGAGGRWWG